MSIRLKTIPVIFENDDFIALNKPSGLLSIPDRAGKEVSLRVLLDEKFHKVYVVHRLDKDTSGLIVFAKNEQTHKALNLLFENREAEKFYEGLVHGIFENNFGKITSPIAAHPVQNGTMMVHDKGKESETDYEVLGSYGNISHVKFKIYTGRTHQIRVHMLSIGHSIVCDPLYGNPQPLFISALKKNYKLSKNELEEKPILSRLALHAAELNFNLNGKNFHLIAPVPKDIRATIQQLKKLR